MLYKNIHFKNFGKVKDAEIRMRPFTMITGHNSSGKSFITRALYSIFYTLNQDLMAIFLSGRVDAILTSITLINSHLIRKTKKDEQLLEELEQKFDGFRQAVIEQFQAATIFQEREILTGLQPAIKELDEKIHELSANWRTGQGTKFKSVEEFFNHLEYSLHQVELSMKNWNRMYASELRGELKQAFIENFQVSSLKQLSFLSNKSEIDFIENGNKDGGGVIIDNNDLNINFLSFFTIADIQEFNNVVYLESPIYFKLRNTLQEARFSHSMFSRRNVINQVPKYFYDTDNLLNQKYIEENLSEDFLKIISKIENGIQGKLSLDSRNNIVFQDNDTPNAEIPFNLVSSGISNLGMIALLLKKNILTKGSFLFIDEPELNLHTEWQHVMLDVLVDLSLAGVNVMVASHSLDMVLRFQNIVENFENQAEIEQRFSLNRLAKDGTSLPSESLLQDIIAAKADLGKPYVDLLKQRLP